MRALLFKAESRAFRAFYDLAGLRPVSGRYLSGDAFRRLAQHRYEGITDRGSFRPDAVLDGDRVYCEAQLLPEFFTRVCPQVNAQFQLISHNGDLTIDARLSGMLPRNVVRWFAQNVAVRHERIVPIPIGLENRRLHTNGVIRDFDRLRRGLSASRKVNRILYGFTIGTNPSERVPCVEALQKSPLAVSQDRQDSRGYRRVLSRYRFVASPPGNGEDCHRTWEALYLNVIPIVKRTILSEYFADLGIPLMLVDDWNSLAALREEDLDRAYAELSTRFDHPALWMDFWISRIGNRSNRK
jgi:hypothetical protein